MPNRKPSTEETLAELGKMYPDLYKFIGDEGTTLYKVHKRFPQESQKTLSEKGFLCTKKKVVLIPTDENQLLAADEKSKK